MPRFQHLPHHEALQAKATASCNFQVNATPCGPSRSVPYTGQDTQKSDMFTNPNVPPNAEVPREMPTMGSIFSELGYYTSYKGNWHLSDLNHDINFDQARYPDTSRALEPCGFVKDTHNGDHHGSVWDRLKHDSCIAAVTSPQSQQTGQQVWIGASQPTNRG